MPKNKNDGLFLSAKDIKYFIKRLERVIELLNSEEPHMAIAKLLADIAVLKGIIQEYEHYKKDNIKLPISRKK